MNAALLIAIAITSAGLSVYLIVFAQKRRRGRIDCDDLLTFEEPAEEEAAIPETSIYQSTKKQMSDLRGALDVFNEAMETLFQAVSPPNGNQIEVVYAVQIPKMHGALLDARQVAYGLLATVEERPVSDSIAQVFGRASTADLTRMESERRSGEDLTQLLTAVKEAVDVIGPGIAAFYLSLTESDERFRVVSAADQISSRVISPLDRALALLVLIEQRISQ